MNCCETHIPWATAASSSSSIYAWRSSRPLCSQKDCIVVPNTATVYAQIVTSEFVKSWNTLNPYIDEESKQTLIDVPPCIQNCGGIGYAHDIQLSQLSLDKFTPLTSAIPVLQFDWSGKTTIPKNRAARKHIEAINSGRAHAVFVWWDLTMNESGTVTLSCAPHWAHPTYNCVSSMPWRDHWLQFIYHLSPDVVIRQGEFLSLLTIHDEFKFRFYVELDTSGILNADSSVVESSKYPSPDCNCRLHTATSHTRIGAMNDPTRRRKYLTVLRQKVSQNSVVLCLSGFSLLGVLCARLGARKVYVIEPAMFGAFVQFFIDHYDLRHQIVVLNSERDVSFIDEKVTLLVGDPFCITSVLPWEHLEDFCLRKSRFSSVLAPNLSIMPEKAVFMFVPVTFDHLWKTRAFVREAEGFSMKCFDEFIAKSRVFSRDQVDGHPLWEYPCSALSTPKELLTIDISKVEPSTGYKSCAAVQIERSGVLHGVAIWIDWYLDANTKISTGAQNQIDPFNTKPIQWDFYSTQGVYFLPEFHQVDETHIVRGSIEYSSKQTNTQFEFSVLTQISS